MLCLMFVRPIVLEELKLTYLRTHIQTELQFIYSIKRNSFGLYEWLCKCVYLCVLTPPKVLVVQTPNMAH